MEITYICDGDNIIIIYAAINVPACAIYCKSGNFHMLRFSRICDLGTFHEI